MIKGKRPLVDLSWDYVVQKAITSSWEKLPTQRATISNLRYPSPPPPPLVSFLHLTSPSITPSSPSPSFSSNIVFRNMLEGIPIDESEVPVVGTSVIRSASALRTEYCPRGLLVLAFLHIPDELEV